MYSLLAPAYEHEETWFKPVQVTDASMSRKCPVQEYRICATPRRGLILRLALTTCLCRRVSGNGGAHSDRSANPWENRKGALAL